MAQQQFDMTSLEAEKSYQALLEFRNSARNVSKAMRRFCEASAHFTAEANQFSEEMLRVTGMTEREGFVGRSGVYFSKTIGAVCNMQDAMAEQISQFCERGLNVFVDFDFQETAELRRRKERLKAEHDALHARAASQRSAASAAQSAPELERLERALAACEAQFCVRVAMLERKRETRFLRALVGTMKAQNEFHEKALKIFGNLRKKLSELDRHLDEIDTDRPEKEGLIQKRNRSKVFVVIKKGFLFQFRENKDFDPDSSLDLMTATVRIPTEVDEEQSGAGNPVAFCFEVHSPKLHRPIRLYAESEKERSEWVKAIQVAVAAKINTLSVQHPGSPTPSHGSSPGLGTSGLTSSTGPLGSSLSSGSLSSSGGGGTGSAATGAPSVTTPPADVSELHGVSLHERVVKMLQAVPGNDVCAECGARQPEWAVINYGIIICLECSGVHRSLGTHISKVRSLTLDRWVPEVVLFLKNRGNRSSNALLEGAIPVDVKRPTPSSDRLSREEFIKNKYVKRAWVAKFDATPEELNRQLFAAANRRSSIEAINEVVRLLIHGAHPNFVSKEDESKTPLMMTLVRGNLLTLEVLLQNGARPSVTDSRGWTPMHYAAFYNRPRCLGRLMQCAKPVADSNGLLPIDIATWNASSECIQVLKGVPGPNVELTLEVVETGANSHEDVFTIPKMTMLPTPHMCATIPRASTKPDLNLSLDPGKRPTSSARLTTKLHVTTLRNQQTTSAELSAGTTPKPMAATTDAGKPQEYHSPKIPKSTFSPTLTRKRGASIGNSRAAAAASVSPAPSSTSTPPTTAPSTATTATPPAQSPEEKEKANAVDSSKTTPKTDVAGKDPTTVKQPAATMMTTTTTTTTTQPAKDEATPSPRARVTFIKPDKPLPIPVVLKKETPAQIHNAAPSPPTQQAGQAKRAWTRAAVPKTREEKPPQ